MSSRSQPRAHHKTAGPPANDRDLAKWYACQTRSRAEKRVVRLLTEKMVEAYLPSLKRKARWADRTKLVTLPMFPGYVFVRFAVRDFHRILSTPGVTTVVRLAGRPAPIASAEIENIRRFAAGLEGLPEPQPPQPFVDGQRVCVIDGPLEGVEGLVFRQGRRTSLLVGLRIIGQGIAVHVQARSLRTISQPSALA